MFNKIWESFGDVISLALSVVLTIVIAYYEPLWLPFCIVLIGLAYYYNNRIQRSKEVRLNSYMDTVVRNIERANHHAVQNLDIGMAVFGKDGKLQWKNELFTKYTGLKNVDGKRPEEVLPLTANAFDTLSVKDGERRIQIEDRYFKMQHCRVQTTEKGDKKGTGLLIYLSDITDMELLQQKYDNEKLCLAYIRFDNYEDVMKGMNETTRASISGEVNEVLSKWAEEENGFIIRANKELCLIGVNQAVVRDEMERKFPVLEKVHEVHVGNKIIPTVSIGIACEGDNLEELGRNAMKALDLALGRGGDQVVVAIDGGTQFFGGTTTVTAKSTRVRARIVAHTIHEQIKAADKVFVMGHMLEDFDSIGSAIGTAKMALSLQKDTYIVVSGETDALSKIKEMLQRDELKLIKDDEQYIELMISGEEAMNRIVPNSLLILVDHHRPMLCASKEVMEAIPKRIIIDHHRRSEDVIKDTVLQYMEPSSSSTSELVTELVGYFNDRLEFTTGEATALYAGIVVDTKNFAVQTGERTFEAAALLRRSGADPTVVRQLFKDDMETFQIRSRLIAEAQSPEPGLVLSVYKDAPKDARSSVIAAQTADAMVSISGIYVSVVIIEYVDGALGVSARSDGTVNVQIIMEELGGGGHQTVAGMQLENKRAADVMPQIIALAKKQLEEIENNESDPTARY